jgi:hypothetical protein
VGCRRFRAGVLRQGRELACHVQEERLINRESVCVQLSKSMAALTISAGVYGRGVGPTGTAHRVIFLEVQGESWGSARCRTEGHRGMRDGKDSRLGAMHWENSGDMGHTFQFLFPGIPFKLSPPRSEVSSRGWGVGSDGVGRGWWELYRLDARLRFTGHHGVPRVGATTSGTMWLG